MCLGLVLAISAVACAEGWRPWDGATAGFSAGLCGTPNCGGSYTKTYNVQACRNAGYKLTSNGVVQEPNPLPHPFGQGAQPALNECSNPGELRRDTCPNILKFAEFWQPNVDGRTFAGTGDKKLLQGFGHAFTKVADRLPCGACAAVRARRELTDGGYNYMIIMRVDVTDDISPEVDEVTAEFGAGVVTQPAYNRIPYEYKLVDCETGQDVSTSMDGSHSTTHTPSPTLAPQQRTPSPLNTPLPTLSPTMRTSAPTSSITQSTCEPIGDCSANSWCFQDAYIAWCTERGSDGQCPPPFCQEVQVPESTATPNSLPTPGPTFAQVSGRSCVASGEGLYTNKEAFEQTCAVLTTAAICEAYPMCKWGSSLLAKSASMKRLRVAAAHHNGVGNAFIQQYTATDDAKADRDADHAMVNVSNEDSSDWSLRRRRSSGCTRRRAGCNLWGGCSEPGDCEESGQSSGWR